MVEIMQIDIRWFLLVGVQPVSMQWDEIFLNTANQSKDSKHEIIGYSPQRIDEFLQGDGEEDPWCPWCGGTQGHQHILQ